MGQEFTPGFFQDDFTSDPGFNPGADPSMPSELGGMASDWNPPESIDYSAYGGSYTSEESGPVAGPDLSFPDLGSLGLGGLLGAGASALGFNDFPGAPGADPTAGGSMDALDFSAAGLPAVRGVPWGSMTKQVRNAARIFGPAMLLPIVSMVAQYWTARLQRLGLQVTISPSALVLKVLSKRGRRGTRGITGRQLAITRRTIGKVQRMHALLSHFTHSRSRAPARSYAFHRRRKR